MRKNIIYIFQFLLTVFSSIIINIAPVNAKKICPIYWGMNKLEFLSVFPDAIPDPHDLHSDDRSKHSTYFLSGKNPCIKKYNITDSDEVVFIFYDSEKLEAVRVGTVNYEETRLKLIEKFGNPVPWERDGDCTGEDICYRSATFNDTNTKSRVYIEGGPKDENSVLILYFPYPPRWLPSSW